MKDFIREGPCKMEGLLAGLVVSDGDCCAYIYLSDDECATFLDGRAVLESIADAEASKIIDEHERAFRIPEELI